MDHSISGRAQEGYALQTMTGLHPTRKKKWNYDEQELPLLPNATQVMDPVELDALRWYMEKTHNYMETFFIDKSPTYKDR